MKFGKVLKVSSENMPSEMHNLFLRYKELKKKIKLIPVTKEAAVGDEKQASVSPDGSSTGSGSSGSAVTMTVLSPEEQAFIITLNEDLARFNRYFIEKEEEAVIRMAALCDELMVAAAAAGLPLPAALINAGLSDHEDAPPAAAVAILPPQLAPVPQQELSQAQQCQEEAPTAAAAQQSGPSSSHGEPGRETRSTTPDGSQQARQRHQLQQHHHHHHQQPLQAVKSRLVQFHGEMVLLLHWSLLNYAAVVKILKKHDKRTSMLLRAPYLANVLQQPFSSTAIMSRLAKRAEELVVATTQLAPAAVPAALRAGGEASAAPAPTGLDSGAAPTATDTAVAAGGTAACDSGLQAGGPAHRGCAAAGGAAAAPSGQEVTSASEASSLTLVAERDATHTGAPHPPTEPLVGSTMHALETWANLRKNAITPSTVLVAEVDQAASKRKADGPASDPDAAMPMPASKAAKAEDAAAR